MRLFLKISSGQYHTCWFLGALFAKKAFFPKFLDPKDKNIEIIWKSFMKYGTCIC